MGSRVVAIIPARYESTRLPGKPLADIHGQPMIQRVYERAQRAAGVDRVLVATDDARIRDAVAHFGGEVVMTSAAHRTGTDRIAEVVANLDADIVVNVQGDLPLLDPTMVAAAVAPLRAESGLPMATIKTAIRGDEELRNPNVVKVVTDRDGFALYFSRSPLPYWRDGAAPADVLAHKHIGLYVYRRDFLLTFARLAPTPLEQAEQLEQLRALEWGFRIKVVEVAAASIEVDTARDLERARALIGAGA
ncbi:MAG: 3-deoxy-manno-octulosonate cytidylyltransferase [Deltaproteobacteria bacterium]|nr:3-deoxy-manno-octulosonate cytidylyltransferase [Deltaproteobacteria bacterium]MBI3388077.1 3-deoxy-manno-octulosonate cytidylyltransferase [Deltaproteobacteria bacterium]